MIRIFIGYDPNETIACHVLAHSIMTRSSQPVSITPLIKRQLVAYTRERAENESTEFSLTRFLVPWLCGFEGHAIFMDCDMLMLDDIADLWKYKKLSSAVHLVKHDHVPTEETKFLGQKQTAYPRKNWSSVMLFDCKKNHSLSPKFINETAHQNLHRFSWLLDKEIGELPDKWNYLADVQPTINHENISNIHYTLGGPYFRDTRNCAYSDIWLKEYQDMVEMKN